MQPHIILFEELAPYQISKLDKEIFFNQAEVRSLISKIVADKREAIKKDPKEGEQGDMLSIMLRDPLFENNDDRIINESMTFFFAGTIS